MRDHIWRWVSGVVLGVTPLTLLVGCSSSSTDEREVNSSQFLHLDEEIVSQRQYSPGTLISNMQPALSNPVDITGNGDYTFTTEAFPCAGFDPNVVDYNSPADTDFNWIQSNAQLIYSDDPENCTVQFVATVTNFKEDYPGFRIWVS